MGQQYDELAYVYARSLFELAEDAGGLEKIGEVLEELEVIVELSRSDSDFREFLSSPIIGLGPRQRALKSIFDGRISDLVLRFLLVTNSKGRLGHIDQITGALGALVQEAHGRIEVDVITASEGEASPELMEAVRSRVQSVLGKEPVLHHYCDPAMIGGIKMRIGDQLVDGSVATRLRRMKEEILGKGATQVRSESERFLEGAS